jgi:hypothetical protein
MATSRTRRDPETQYNMDGSIHPRQTMTIAWKGKGSLTLAVNNWGNFKAEPHPLTTAGRLSSPPSGHPQLSGNNRLGAAALPL